MLMSERLHQRKRRARDSLVRGDKRRGLVSGLSLSSQVGGHVPESRRARVQDYGSSISLWPGVYLVYFQQMWDEVSRSMQSRQALHG